MKRTQAPVLLLLSVLLGVWVATVWKQPAMEPVTGTSSADSRETAFSRAPTDALPSASSEPAAEVRARSIGHGSPAVAAPLPPMASPSEIVADAGERRARKLAALDRILADTASFADLPEEYRSPLALYAGQLAVSETPAVRCWSPDTPADIVRAYQRVEQQIEAAGGLSLQALQVGGHWFRTATNGSGQSTQGQPVTLTWSIVPDGTSISGGVGEPTAPSALRARLATIYGGSASGDPRDQPWFSVFQATFDNLAANSGLRFVYEPADDGSAIGGGSLSGALNVRGDIRISGHPIDGNSGTLAYAYFPDSGDMVIDTNDTYYNNAPLDNSIRLRNILEHEIGHSLGLNHVCPVNATKLMEPFINLGFRGSQFDDIYSHQRNYGDALEVHGTQRSNDSPATATALGLVAGTPATWPWLSIDDSTDIDHFSFSGATTQQLTVRIIPAVPPVTPYLEGAQNSDGSCSAGTPFDPATRQNLVLDLLAGNGTTVVASAPVQPAGTTEEIVSFQLPANGTHYIRVRGGTDDAAQLYRMEASLVNASPAPQVVITSTRLDAESNSGGNGAPDPGETIRLGITLRNTGNLPVSNLVATLSAPAGSTLFSATANYGTLAAGATAEQLFTFALDGVPGNVRNLQVSVIGSGYSAVLPLSLTLGSLGQGFSISENFDASPSLPAGWSQTTSGAASAWTTSTSQSTSAPRAAFAAGVASAGEATLVSPTVTVGANGGTLEFDHLYSLSYPRDGGVLEVSRNGGAWTDIVAAGASFTAGAYVANIITNPPTSIDNRAAWTGPLNLFTTTRVAIPTAWAGDTVAFRWRLVHDKNGASVGWYIDDVTFYSIVPVADPFRPFVSLDTSASTLAEGAGPVTLTLSTPLPLVQPVIVAPQLAGSADAADLDAAPFFVLPAGQTSVTADIAAVNDGLAEGPESLAIGIPGGSPDFAPGASPSVALEISDGSLQTATVTLSDLEVTFTGDPQTPTVTTVPPGLSFYATYNESFETPSAVGSYLVVVTIDQPGYEGSASGTFVIRSPYAAWISAYSAPDNPLAEPGEDLDRDGWDNAAEYAFGTLPGDPASRPHLEPVLTANSMRLMVPDPPPGITLSAETSTGLGSWTTLGVNRIPGGYEVPRDASRRFLRVVYQLTN